MKDLAHISRPLSLTRVAAGSTPLAAASASAQVRHLRVSEAYAGQRLDNFLIRELKGVPKTHVYRIVRSGEVRVNGRRAKAETKLAAGDELRIPPVRVAAEPEYKQLTGDFPHEIVWEDDHLIEIGRAHV